MTYFQEYMTKTLERDVDWVFSDQQRTKDMDFLVKYYRMKNAIVFKLSNDVVQVRTNLENNVSLAGAERSGSF